MIKFIKCCMNGNIDNIKKMSLKNCNLEQGFRWACGGGHYDIVQYLVELHKNDKKYKYIDIHSCDEGFIKACEEGHYDIVKYLLKITKKIKPFKKYVIAFKKINKYLI